jgi:D-alanyl-D-alanine carboxypeptidase (penicillin-binding protein 5/6)
LAQDSTVIGIKPGYTQLAGQTLVTEAVRDGRTMLVVLLNDKGADIYSDAEGLFNQGFATPFGVEAGAETLPAVRTPPISAAAASTATVSARAKPMRTAVSHSYRWKRLELFALAGLGGSVYFRRRSVRRRREARRAFNPAQLG